MIGFDQYTYCNRLAKTHPGEKILLAGGILLILLAADNVTVSIVAGILMSCITVWGAGIPVRAYAKTLIIPLIFILIGGGTVMVSTGPTSREFLVSFPFGGQFWGISSQGWGYGSNLILKSLASVSSLYFVVFTTSMIDTIAFLQKMRVPGVLLEIMSLTYRFIFIFIDTAYAIIIAQASRLGYLNMKKSLVSLSMMFSSLMVKTLMKSKELHVSLASRGYQGDLKVLQQDYPVSPWNIMIILVIHMLLGSISLAGKVLN